MASVSSRLKNVNPSKVVDIYKMKLCGHQSYSTISENLGLNENTVREIVANDGLAVIEEMAGKKFKGRRSYAQVASQYGMSEQKVKDALYNYRQSKEKLVS